ncbi:MAG: HIT family protein [Beijerinckiaceae bacterium]|jgi:histidine triad (HIT) family protein|nr:HIT family protein [Beijerinckiaceae bacterium]
MRYDPDNIFAKILRGEIPCHKVYEDDAVLSFMDIMPRSPGHLLVIPKAPARNLLDIAPDDLAALIRRVQRIALAAKEVLGAEGITLQQFSEAAGGQEVFHIHFHVLPRWEGQRMTPHPAPRGDMAVLAEQAARIRATLGQ